MKDGAKRPTELLRIETESLKLRTEGAIVS